jgi:hypothetical protein
MHGPLGAARVALIKWLLEAGSRQGTDPSPATVRTQAGTMYRNFVHCYMCTASVAYVSSACNVVTLTEVWVKDQLGSQLDRCPA